jgi:surfeit locus 1 family protein
MKSRWPVVPSIIAAIAVLILVALGIWQLERKAEKEALLLQLESAANLPSIAYPSVPISGSLPLYRASSVMCIRVAGWRTISGSNALGEAGFAHLATCQTGGAEGPGAVVAIGWSKQLVKPQWKGGIVGGIIAPDNDNLIRLVATDSVPGLTLLARPSPDSIPNNHLVYAIQWFFFAAAAAIIFVLAVMKKRREEMPK